MDIGIIISFAAMLIAAMGLILSGRKGTREDAAGTARLEAKIDSISAGVEDIRVEIRSMRARMDSLSERLAAVEISCKSAHHRIDQLQTHPPS